MKSILTLALKDLKLEWRDPVGFFWRFGFPLAIAVLFGAIFSGNFGSGGGASATRVAVVDEDKSDLSARFVERLESAEQLRIERFGETQQLPDLATARDQVRLGKVSAYIRIPEGFGRQFSNPFAAGNFPELEMGTDPSQAAASAMLEGTLTAMLFEQATDLLTDQDFALSLVRQSREDIDVATDLNPLERTVLSGFFNSLETFVGSEVAFPKNPPTADQGTDDSDDSNNGALSLFTIRRAEVTRDRIQLPSSYYITFPQGIVWVFIGTAAGFSISLVSEREKGTLLRLRMAPLSTTHVLAGKGLACFIMLWLNTIMLMIIGRFVFGVTPGSYGLFALAVTCGGIAFVGLMMLIATLGKTEAAVGGIGYAIMLVMAMLGGGMVPLFILPEWVLTVGSVSPVRWLVQALEGAMWRGFTLSEMALPCGVLLAMGVLFFVAGAISFGRQRTI